MKTSNMIILSAFAIVVIGLFVNAFQLRKLYVTTDFTDPYYNCIKLDIPQVQAIYIESQSNPEMWSSDEVNIVKGERCMFATPDTSQFKLIIADSGLIIKTKVRHVKAYIVLPELAKVAAADREEIKINDFVCDSLLLNTNHATISLEQCNIHQLTTKSVGGRISVMDDNTIRNANIKLRNGTFTSGDVSYETATCNADATSSVNLAGRSIGMFH